AHAIFAKGKYAKAIEDLKKLALKGGEIGESADALAKDFIKRLEGKFARVDWLLENAYLVKAEEAFDDLAKATKGVEELAEKTAALQATFDAEDMKEEMKAAKELAKLEEKLMEDGLDAKILKKIAKFAESNADKKVAKRAQHLVSLGE
ncbi:MAG: hypothetical protein KDB61_05950, partial [Planctomycetes bacterium]|nr:hypothetical protein [Planctomycetota bacterium]